MTEGEIVGGDEGLATKLVGGAIGTGIGSMNNVGAGTGLKSHLTFEQEVSRRATATALSIPVAFT